MTADPRSRGPSHATAASRRRWLSAPTHRPPVARSSSCLIWLLPTIGLFINSFRSVGRHHLIRLVDGPVPAVGAESGQLRPGPRPAGHLGSAFLNSLYITIPATLIPTMVAAFTAYAFAWMSSRGGTVCSWSWWA